LTAAALVLAIAACGDNTRSDDLSTDASLTEDSAMDDVLGANTATDNEAAVALPTDAAGFATAVAASDLYEIESSTLAAQKASSKEVKELAAHLKTDHQKSSAQLKAAAAGAGTTVTPALDAEKQQLLDELKAASGAEFDRLFLEQQRSAHQKALSLLQSYAQGGDNEALKGFAKTAMPVIQGHLAHANRIKI
jgi:putative membrane protein